jgi:hypothetical protein
MQCERWEILDEIDISSRSRSIILFNNILKKLFMYLI